MVVNITVPDDLEEYLEYVPEAQLQNVFLEALRYKLSNSCGAVFNYRCETEQLASLISEKLLTQGNFQVAAPVQETVSITTEPVVEPKQKVTVVNTVELDFDEDDDLSDFMDLIK